MTDADYERIASRIHEFYREQSVKEGWANDFPMPYSDLPEFMKADNRAAARRIGEVLALAGLRLEPRGNAVWDAKDRDDIRERINDNLELLAEGEHDGWTEARLRHGWRLGPVKDVDKREHHLLVPWSEFRSQIECKRDREAKAGRTFTKTLAQEVEQAKDKDRDSVRNYIVIIADANYRIVAQ